MTHHIPLLPQNITSPTAVTVFCKWQRHQLPSQKTQIWPQPSRPTCQLHTKCWWVSLRRICQVLCPPHQHSTASAQAPRFSCLATTLAFWLDSCPSVQILQSFSSTGWMSFSNSSNCITPSIEILQDSPIIATTKIQTSQFGRQRP